MTDLELQQVIVDEIKALTERQMLRKLDGEAWKDYNLYIQEKPLKDDEYDEDQEDYIIVMLDDEDTNGDGDWIVTVHIIMSIMLMEEQHQGNLILANLMNQLDFHFRRKGIIGEKYEMEKERHKRFNQECYPNYYECDYITKWKLPDDEMEGLEKFL